MELVSVRTPATPPVRELTRYVDPMWLVSMADVSAAERRSPWIPSTNSCPTRCSSVMLARASGAQVAELSRVGLEPSVAPGPVDVGTVVVAHDAVTIAARQSGRDRHAHVGSHDRAIAKG